MTTFKIRRFHPEDNIRVCEVFARSISDFLLRPGDEALVNFADPKDWQRFWDRRKSLFNHLAKPAITSWPSTTSASSVMPAPSAGAA